MLHMDYLDFINILPHTQTFNDANLPYIKERLERGWNPNKQYYGGFSVLHHAINNFSDNIKVVEELIRAGADVNLTTHLDFTPLHFAVAYRKHRVIKALIQSGASVNAKDFLGRTSLHFACSVMNVRGVYIYRNIPDTEVIKELLQHEKIDCNAQDLNGNTPLMIAIKHDEMMIAAQLLQDNADPNVCNNALETPLHAAFSHPVNGIEIHLLKRGANIYSVNKNGEIPLEILFKHCYFRWLDEWILSDLKIIAFHYNITNALKKKFEIFSQLSYYKIISIRMQKKIELIPQLSHYFNKFCNEVHRMKSDFIFGNITMHDFVMDCFNLNDFKYQVEQMKNDFILDVLIITGVSWNDFKEDHLNYRQNQFYGAVIERLVKNIYPEYISPIFDMIPAFILSPILQITANRKKVLKTKGKVKTLADLFSLLDIINLFSKHLSKVDFLCLIAALSDVKDVNSMQNLRGRNFFTFFERRFLF